MVDLEAGKTASGAGKINGDSINSHQSGPGGIHGSGNNGSEPGSDAGSDAYLEYERCPIEILLDSVEPEKIIELVMERMEAAAESASRGSSSRRGGGGGGGGVAGAGGGADGGNGAAVGRHPAGRNRSESGIIPSSAGSRNYGGGKQRFRSGSGATVDGGSSVSASRVNSGVPASPTSRAYSAGPLASPARTSTSAHSDTRLLGAANDHSVYIETESVVASTAPNTPGLVERIVPANASSRVADRSALSGVTPAMYLIICLAASIEFMFIPYDEIGSPRAHLMLAPVCVALSAACGILFAAMVATGRTGPGGICVGAVALVQAVTVLLLPLLFVGDTVLVLIGYSGALIAIVSQAMSPRVTVWTTGAILATVLVQSYASIKIQITTPKGGGFPSAADMACEGLPVLSDCGIPLVIAADTSYFGNARAIGTYVIIAGATMVICVLRVRSIAALFAATRIAADAVAERTLRFATLVASSLPAHVSKVVMARIAGGSRDTSPIAARHRASLVFQCDIVSFSTLTAAMPPGEVLSFLKDFSAVVEAAAAAHGVIKTVTRGDSWQGAILSDDTSPEALRTALTDRMLPFALEVAARVPAEVAVPGSAAGIALRIGIATGTVDEGVVGSTDAGAALPAWRAWGEAIWAAESTEAACPNGMVNLAPQVAAALGGGSLLPHGVVSAERRPAALPRRPDLPPGAHDAPM
jgi:class 3 adenylate cyclase